MKNNSKKSSLYVHVPFCRKKCFYCSFPVAVAGKVSIEKYLQCLLKEIKLCKVKSLKTIYIGGGTPSYFNDGQLMNLFKLIRSDFKFSQDVEFTIEVNPEDINDNKVRLLKEYGINRISLGAQSFNDHYLKYLGRTHGTDDIYASFDRLRKGGFDNINLDMMYSFPRQTLQEIKRDLKSLVSLTPEHVSYYSLTIEEQSRFYVKGVQMPDKHKQAKAYEQVRYFLEENGLRQYEVSNFAKPGKASQHNLNYWLGGNYFGVGMGAHSHCNGRRSWNVSRLKEYLQRMEANNPPEEGNECLSPEKRFKEALLFGLRMNQGVDIRKLEDRFHYCLKKEENEKVDCFVEDGLLNSSKGIIKVTNKGRLVLDEISARLI